MHPPSLEQRLAVRERPRDSPVMFQRWSHLLFLHWKVPADWLKPSLPDGLHLDTFNSEAYLGIVPFFMENIRPRFCPPIPGLSWFLELNLRTYVHDDEGRPGVWFYSLDCNQPVAVEIARRLFHLPYVHARMSAARNQQQVHYTSTRDQRSRIKEPQTLLKDRTLPHTHWQSNPPPNYATYRYQPEGASRQAEPGTLEFFLLERYLLFSTNKTGQIFRGQVHHSPYPFHSAACDLASKLPFHWNGFPEPAGGPDSALYSPGVNVDILPLKRADSP